MSSSSRAHMPPNRRGECISCGAGIPYHGRRDLLAFVASCRRELDAAFTSSGRLADVACAIAGRCAVVDASARGLCASCASNQAAAPVSRQLNLLNKE